MLGDGPAFVLPRGGAYLRVEEFVKFARWVGEHEGFTVVMEGVESAKATGEQTVYKAVPVPEAGSEKKAAMKLGSKAEGGPVFRLARSAGVLHSRELRAFSDWLQKHVFDKKKIASPDVTTSASGEMTFKK